MSTNPEWPLQPPPRERIREDVERALREDVGSGDVTAALVPAHRRAEARVISREAAVICGAPWVDEVCRQVDRHIGVRWEVDEGASVQPEHVVCRLQGPARSLLTAERTALNFLQLLSGTATTTRTYVDAVASSTTRILDTRKTLPGLRAAQKYAVRAGGGTNHRHGLYDAYLIKENHIAACGSVRTAVELARLKAAGTPVEVEVESLADLDEALAAGADWVLLDNFTPDDLRSAVVRAAGHARLEVSGGVSLPDVAALAATGVDFISVGALTKHVRAVDLSMRLTES